MTDVATNGSAPAEVKQRVEKPDEEKFKVDEAAAVKERDSKEALHVSVDTYDNRHSPATNISQKAAQEKWAKARGAPRAANGEDQPKDRFQVLVDEQKSIRDKQKENKASKGSVQDKSARNEENIKKLMNDRKEMGSRAGFKSLNELESQIKSLEARVDSGKMAVVDEKKTLEEVRNHKRQRKTFEEMDNIQKKIDQLRLENGDLRKSFDNPEARALSDKYEANQKELDSIKAERATSRKGKDSIKAEADKAYAEKQTAYDNLKKLRDAHWTQRRAFKAQQDEVYNARRERQKTERDAYEKDKRRKVADIRLEEASAPAFGEEIHTAETLIKYFDPSYSTAEVSTDPGKFAASAQRTVDEDKFKDMKPLKKEEEDFFTGGGGKKKKGKKVSSKGDFQIGLDIIESCAKVGIDPPSSKDGVPAVVESLKKKVDAWKSDQKAQTEKNIAKAKGEIEKLEAEPVADTQS